VSVSSAFTEAISPLGGRIKTGISDATVLRLLLLFGCVACVSMAVWIGKPQHYLASDADLAQLLRGMALIKGLLSFGAVSVLFWRFGHSLSQRMACAYLIGAWMASGASMLVWQLTSIPLAALIFHAGEVTMLLTAWRDRGGP
jgi:hypothetical protein